VNMSDDEQDIGPIVELFAGYSDGTIKLWNLKSGNCTLHIEKQSKKEKSKNCLIWQLALYKNKYLISGDSKGEVCIFDSKFGTL